ncbi:MAG: serine protease [Calditrichaeota bacterium]|nr:serine protease [Calditrichota bacterium]
MDLTESIWVYIQAGNLNPSALFNYIHQEISKLLSDSGYQEIDQEELKSLTISVGKYVLKNYDTILKDKIGWAAKGLISSFGLSTTIIGGIFGAVTTSAGVKQDNDQLKESFFKEFEAYLIETSGKKPLELLEANPKKILKGEEVYKLVKSCVVEINSPIGTGSGVFYHQSDLVVTNRHVVGGATHVTVRLFDSEEYKGRVELSFRDVDLAFVRVIDLDQNISPPGLCEVVAEGETVYAIGSPRNLTGSITRGAISSIGRFFGKVKYIQHDAAINYGNSGGPLFNRQGELLGINTSGFTDYEGLGFALPLKTISERYHAHSIVFKSGEAQSYCPICGHVTLGTVTYCENCGVNLKLYEPPQKQSGMQNNFKSQCSCGHSRQDLETYCSRCGQTLLIQGTE